MCSNIADFIAILRQLDATKPPGVSGSRIRKLSDFAAKHPQNYREVISALSSYVKTSPSANKLGVLYVVDAIVRAYQEDAKKHGANSDSAAAFAACRSEMPEWMENMQIRRQSVEQFDKMRKMLDIWQRAETVDSEILDEWQRTYFLEPYSTTPPSTPPHNWAGLPEDAIEEPKVAPKKKVETPNAEALFGMLQTLAKSKPVEPKPPTVPIDAAKASKSPPVGSPSLLDPAPTPANGADPASMLHQLIAKSNGDVDPRMAAFGGGMSQVPRGRPTTTAVKTASFERNRSRSPSRQESPESSQPVSRLGDATRNLTFDDDLKPDRIRVFSRTLYVGAIPERYNESELRQLLETVAPLQSVILNRERHHAFVKLKSRKEAEEVRDRFERDNREGRSVLRIKWGVGFGPRDCFDYYRGVSVIPIIRLTDADRKWATSAEYGGTGGLALQPGMSMEEPDIEVGAGSLGSKNMQRQKMMQQQQQQQQMMMMMGGGMPGMPAGMPGMIPGAVPGAMPGMPGMPGAMPGAMPGMPGAIPGMPAAMPGMFPMMPGFPMMPPVGGAPPSDTAKTPDMSQFFMQMQQMQQMPPHQP